MDRGEGERPALRRQRVEQTVLDIAAELDDVLARATAQPLRGLDGPSRELLLRMRDLQDWRTRESRSR